MQIAWDDLKLLLAIGRAGSLAGAARALKVNHSTVFRRLQSCETALGVRVFDRSDGGYRATAEGEQILAHAEAMDAQVQALERTVAGKDFRLAGTIRITAAANLVSAYVAPLLPLFHAQYPDIRVELLAGDRAYDLTRREADLALRATNSPPPYLVGRRVCTLPWWVFAASAPGVGAQLPTTMSELADFPLIGPEASLLRLPEFTWMQANFPESSFVARASDLDSIAALTRTGLGLSILPIDQRQPGLQALFPVDPEFSEGLWLLLHPDLRKLQRLTAFSDFLIEHLRKDARLTVGQ